MTKEVLLSIRGLQFTNDSNDTIEMITVGNYYNRNGKHYLLYDEIMEGFEGVTKNIIKISSNSVDITKKGVANVHMAFEENKNNTTCYHTPFGDLMIGLSTQQITVDEQEKSIDVQIHYSLDINYKHVSNCNIAISVKPKEDGQIHLQE